MLSIQKTITRLVLLSVVSTLVIGLLFIDHIVSKRLSEQFDIVLESKANALITLTEAEEQGIQLEFADEIMLEYSSKSDPAYFELFLASGKLIERSKSFAELSDFEFHYPTDEVTKKDIQLADGRAGRQITIKFIPRFDDEWEGTDKPEHPPEEAIIRVGMERESLDQVRGQFLALIVGTGLTVFILTVFSVTRSIKTSLKPLLRIRDEISQITPKTMDRRLTTKDQPGELAPIAEQFNLVLSEIEKAFQREREFSSDVAHELRTPIAELRSLAEVGLRWPDEQDLSSYFKDIHESASHLDILVSSLLQLCSYDEDQIIIEISEVNLQQLFEKVCSIATLNVDSRILSIFYSPTTPPVLLVDANLLEMLIQNLISNAVAHSPPEAEISINVITQADQCSIEIVNPMSDVLCDEDLRYIFDRFWCKDTSRTSSKHVGIGLALVKSYADCLDIEVQVTIQEEKYFCIRLSNIKTSY